MAVDCKNHSRDGKDIFFYKLPHHNEQLSTKWLVNLRNPKIPQLLNHSYVCSDHFELDCFGRNIKVMNASDGVTLKSRALTSFVLLCYCKIKLI